MGHYTKLQIFVDSYEMVKLLLPKINKINKSYKYIIGEEAKRSAIRMLSLINIINTTENMSERLKYMKQFQCYFENIKLCMKLCIDLNLLSAKEFSNIYPLMKNIHEQFIKWRGFTEKTANFSKQESIYH